MSKMTSIERTQSMPNPKSASPRPVRGSRLTHASVHRPGRTMVWSKYAQLRYHPHSGDTLTAVPVFGHAIIDRLEAHTEL